MRRQIVCCYAAASVVLCGQAAAQEEKVDWQMVNLIRNEGFERSQVMDLVRHLTDEIGPRLTGSPQMKRANEWTRDTLKRWGLKNAHLEGFDFGRGWSFTRVAVHMLKPHEVPLFAIPVAWTPGTKGPVRGEVIHAPIESAEDLERYRGKLKNKIVFIEDPEARPSPETVFHRFSAQELTELASFEQEDRGFPPEMRAKFIKSWQLRDKLRAYLTEEAPLAVVRISPWEGGIIRVGGSSAKVGESATVPELALVAEHYQRVIRYVKEGKTVEIELDIGARFHDDDTRAYNTIAEIPGTTKANEIVMVGAHLDSWHAGTGAVDNAAGCAVAMEAMRILRAVGARPARTIRIALWSGEEQGLLGSKAYVAQHLATRPENKDPKEKDLPPWARNDGWPITTKPAHKQLAAYFNLDNGSGKIRGIYTEGNAAVKPIFTAWFRPFEDLDAGLVTLRGTGGTDHMSFDRVGLPGFQFVQDGLDYRSRLHHTNLDVYDHIEEKDLIQASVIMAAFLYHAAMRPEPLPRKPMPRRFPDPSQKDPAKAGNLGAAPSQASPHVHAH